MPGAVVLTSSAGAFPGLAEALRDLPVPVEERPLLAFEPPLDWGPVDRAIQQLGRYEALAFTSPRAARAFAERASGRLAVLTPPIWAGGPGTAEALSPLSPHVRTPPETEAGRLGAAAALAGAMIAAGVRGPVLFPCGEIRREELPARLRHAGVDVDEAVCYRAVLADEAAARQAAEGARVLVVASPSVADLLARSCPEGERPGLLAVGPTTAASARASGWMPGAVAHRPTVDALVAGVRVLLAHR